MLKKSRVLQKKSKVSSIERMTEKEKKNMRDKKWKDKEKFEI